MKLLGLPGKIYKAVVSRFPQPTINIPTLNLSYRYGRFRDRYLQQDLFLASFAFFSVLIVIPVITDIYFAKDITSKEGIMNKNDTGVVLLDRGGKPFFAFYQAKAKDYTSLPDISLDAQHAIVASEDKDFYKHKGFSVTGIARSVLADLKTGELTSGGSTITQQLVKNSLLSPSKNFLRKYQEIILAMEIEKRYSKNEILEMYLNSVYFGQGSFGIQAAAQNYFNKDAKDLDLAESSFLAGILPAPSKYSPSSGNLDEADARQKTVLEKMVEQKYISEDQKDQAGQEKLVFSQNKQINAQAPHFALMVLDELNKKYGEENITRSGFKVRTTIDLNWQAYTQRVVANQVAHLAPDRVSNGAAVVIDPRTGEVKTLVGSKDWYDDKDGKVNVVTSLRQPGSAFKPVVYAAAFQDRAITPATVLHDVPTIFPGNYRPKDYDGKYRGDVLPRRALANSLNIPSTEVMSKVGLSRVLDMTSSLGITTLNDPSRLGLSLVLGTGEVKLLELTNAYAAFANGGLRNDITTILKIDDKSGHNIYTYQPYPKAAVEPETAFLISSILSDNNARKEEFGDTLTISRPAAVKTGTTEDYKDSVTVGFTPSLAIGVWVGNSNGSPMDNVAGSLGAAPIWRGLMEKFLAGTPIESFTKPPGIIAMPICGSSRVAENNLFPINQEYFIQGTQPKSSCIQIGSSPKNREGTTRGRNHRDNPRNIPHHEGHNDDSQSVQLQPSNLPAQDQNLQPFFTLYPPNFLFQ